jgi:putative ABC transport system permease protein
MSLEAISQAFRLLWAHKLRSVLTMFGVVWGTAAVIFLVGWGDGVNAVLEDGFYRAGKNMGEVWAGRVSEDFTPAVDRRYLWYTYEDVQVLRNRARLPEIVGGESWRDQPASFRQAVVNVDLRGIEAEVGDIRMVPIAAGRGITRADVESRARVAVVGDTVRKQLLGPEGVIGTRIRIGGISFKIIGFHEHVGTQLNRDRMLIDEQVWIPITTLQANWPVEWSDQFVVSKIIYRMRDTALLEATEDEVRAILAERLKVDATDKEAVGTHSAVKVLRELPIGESKGLMFILAATTLAIGGIGVLSMMLDSVHERRHEIGVRLAVGARRRDIVEQFFLETLTVTLFGGLTGVALGVGGCLGLGALALPDLVPVPVLSGRVVLLAVSVMLAVGLSAGVVPAWRASRIDPAVTLRMD